MTDSVPATVRLPADTVSVVSPAVTGPLTVRPVESVSAKVAEAAVPVGYGVTVTVPSWVMEFPAWVSEMAEPEPVNVPAVTDPPVCTMLPPLYCTLPGLTVVATSAAVRLTMVPETVPPSESVPVTPIVTAPVAVTAPADCVNEPPDCMLTVLPVRLPPVWVIGLVVPVAISMVLAPITPAMESGCELATL